MKKNVVILVGVAILAGLVFLLVTGCSAGEKEKAEEKKKEKTKNIGQFSWYTEQNTFDEMIQIAQKADKPIMAVFSATWCKPCQMVKKAVFETADFKKIADEAVLLYVEQTTTEGANYNKKYNVNSWPTFKIFSKQGIMLDTGRPKRTVEGFLEWLSDVKAGNNFHELKKKLEKDPNDRQTLLKIVDKMGRREADKKISYLKRAIKINPDFNEETSQKLYEKLAQVFVQNIPNRDEKKKTDYLDKHHPLFRDIVKTYYPDKLKYQLKGNSGLVLIIGWYNRMKKFDEAFSFFNDFLKQKKGEPDLVKDIPVITTAINTYIGLGKIDEAGNWIMKAQNSSKDTENIKKNKEFVYPYLQMFTPMIEHFAEKGQKKEAEKYAGLYFDEMSRFGEDRMKKFMIPFLASRYDIFTGKALETIDEILKTARGLDVLVLTIKRAKITAQMGKKEKAGKLLLALYENKEFLKTLDPKSLPGVLNEIAWTMLELKTVNQKSLEIAGEAVSLNASPGFMDTLACIHAELGNFKEAVKIQKEAVNKIKKESQKKEYTEKIRAWEKKIK